MCLLTVLDFLASEAVLTANDLKPVSEVFHQHKKPMHSLVDLRIVQQFRSFLNKTQDQDFSHTNSQSCVDVNHALDMSQKLKKLRT